MADSKSESEAVAMTLFKAAKKGKVFTVGHGVGGIEEMATYLDDRMVLFGVLVFSIGSGTFLRHKLVYMHFNGEDTKAMTKAKVNSQRNKVTDLFGHTHGHFTIHHAKDCTLDHIIATLEKVFVSDDGDFSVKDIKAQYESMVAATKIHQMSLAGESRRRTAKEFAKKIKIDQVMKAIQDPLGPFNWALFKPNKKNLKSSKLAAAERSDLMSFVNAGSMSIDEMMDELDDEEIYVGILRMGFGTGKFRRTKWIGIWWGGTKVGAVTRGKIGAKKGACLNALKPFSFDYTAHNKEDMSIENIVEIVHKKLVVDGAKDETGKDPYTVEAFYEALEEEVEANKDFFGDKTIGGGEAKAALYDPATAVKHVRNVKNDINWALLGLKL